MNNETHTQAQTNNVMIIAVGTTRPRWDTPDAEIKTPSAEHQELSQVKPL